MRWRVRSRRATTHPLVSVRRAAASSLLLACARLPCAFTVAASASSSLPTSSLKEGRSPPAHPLLFVRFARFHRARTSTHSSLPFWHLVHSGRRQSPALLLS